MGYVRSFVGFRPSPRYDAVSWSEVEIQEALTATGPWTGIETQALAPLDTDPTDPEVRNVTTSAGTLSQGWYRLVFKDPFGGTEELLPYYYDGSQSVSAIPTAQDIRERTPNIEWAEKGYPAPDSGEPDSLDPLIPEAVAEFRSLIGIDPATVTGPVVPIVSRALRMLVAYNAGVETEEILDTAVDYDMIQSFGASIYNETRRAISANRTVLHPWPALNKLLLGIMFFDQAGQQAQGQGPAISTDNASRPTPGEWYMDPLQTHRGGIFGPFAPPTTVTRYIIDGS